MNNDRWKMFLITVLGVALIVVIAPKIVSQLRFGERRNAVRALHAAVKKGDFKEAAVWNSVLSSEAQRRALRVLKAWEKLRDPETGLVPRNKESKDPYWNAKDTAADLFPFLVLAAHYLDRDNEALWLKTLSAERAICGPMPCSIRLKPTKVIDESLPDKIFGASEYAKDGLLAVAERLGRGPWFERLEEIAQTLIDAAYIETEYGKISSASAEVNGEMLQILSRLYWATGNAAFIEMAERITEVYLFEILPKNQGLPANYWNFSDEKPGSSYFRLRDHGSEIVAGLAEVYFLEKVKNRPKAAEYREPFKKLLDRLLITGRTADGLWQNTVDMATQEVKDKGIVDTWGYLLNAYQMFDLAEGTSIYTDEIKRTMRAVAARTSVSWERRSHDGHADTIESMLYLLPWFDLPECHRWVDEQIEKMFAMQMTSGFIKRGEYLDGNFIRTALMYAKYKSQGLALDPWRADTSLGAAYDKNNKELYIHIDADTSWKGVIKFETSGGPAVWNFPIEYPRLNASSKWFFVDPQKDYEVLNFTTGEKIIYSGKKLVSGLSAEIAPERFPLSLKISEIGGQ